ncbi:heavy metal translocating P-type ATPase [Candidatus Methylacidithermus pantelleriae]|uniref:Lead, cadmium, zinc and mercury transporting ATPase n=1 Tax=Candidatus Methylacidithermus pantelleriae TaxID=2744239 RepID=A0A8J2BNS0_9BACT|nr:cation-translocating P-type ATPase [Candidatus Methylacidithermus pantelleriae]CAF0697207.1 Lead, cadmium, zinc and mercury transporting ATPase [Candidatus Methylacidithermus pantelleriae]
MGYRTTLRVQGMSCANCARHVREALERVDGVARVSVELETACATVEGKGDAPPLPELLQAVQEAGYEATPLSEGRKDLIGWKQRIIIGGFFTSLLFLWEWFGPMEEGWPGWVQLAMALPVQFVTGAPFYQGAWRQARQGRLNMDTLVALGSSAAFFLSFYGLLRPSAVHHLYFDEAAAIITLVGIGHWLEHRATERATGALRGLLSLAPDRAMVLLPDGKEELRELWRVRPGDRVVLRPGDRVPVDGTIVEGTTTLDESMLSGEAQPVSKGPGEPVFAGTTNLDGRVLVEVKAAGSDTVLAHIARVVERAQSSRASVQRFVDKVSNIFVVVVVLLAGATALFWGQIHPIGWESAWIRAVSVLIVACPCAMGLATPAAIMVAANVAAHRGILIRDALALEKCGNIDTVIFDKTGTLSRAGLFVEELVVSSAEEKEAGSLFRSLAWSSHHPVSQAITRHFSQFPFVEISHWREERGSGVEGIWNGKRVRLGNFHWLSSCGVSLPEGSRENGSRIGLAVEGTLIAWVRIGSEPKEEAARVITELRKQGFRVGLLSGDSREATLAFARKVGLHPDEVIAEVRPHEKAQAIARWQEQGRRVAFVGDGINDAPALAQADLGIAVLGATDLAKESSDVVLLRAEIENIPFVLQLALATLRTIRQNLFWAFFYNASAIPLAVVGWVSPVVCAAAMGLSDLFVLGNALRLYRLGRSS